MKLKYILTTGTSLVEYSTFKISKYGALMQLKSWAEVIESIVHSSH